MWKLLFRFVLGLRLALVRIAIDQAEAVESRTAERLETLVQKELNIRIQYLQTLPVSRCLVSFPE